MGIILAAIVAYPAVWIFLHVIEISIRRWRINREQSEDD